MIHFFVPFAFLSSTLLTTDNEYSADNRNNLPLIFQIQLPEKVKTLCSSFVVST